MRLSQGKPLEAMWEEASVLTNTVIQKNDNKENCIVELATMLKHVALLTQLVNAHSMLLTVDFSWLVSISTHMFPQRNLHSR